MGGGGLQDPALSVPLVKLAATRTTHTLPAGSLSVLHTHTRRRRAQLPFSGSIFREHWEACFETPKSAEQKTRSLLPLGRRILYQTHKKRGPRGVASKDVAVEGGGGARDGGRTCLLRDQSRARWKVSVSARERETERETSASWFAGIFFFSSAACQMVMQSSPIFELKKAEKVELFGGVGVRDFPDFRKYLTMRLRAERATEIRMRGIRWHQDARHIK